MYFETFIFVANWRTVMRKVDFSWATRPITNIDTILVLSGEIEGFRATEAIYR